MSELVFRAKRGPTSARPIAPSISPWGGRFPSASQSVTITSRTREAQIYYTTDGTNPTTSSTLYSGTFTLNIGAGSTKTLKAIAYDATLSTPTSRISTAIFKGYGFAPAEDWYDNNGNLIDAYGGCVL